MQVVQGFCSLCPEIFNNHAKIINDYLWLGLIKEKGRWLWVTGEEYPEEKCVFFIYYWENIFKRNPIVLFRQDES